jgi:hypothetical protein
VVGNEGFAKQMVANNIALLQGNKADTISSYWSDNYSKTDDNVICSNADTNDDQQNITRHDDNTTRMSKTHNKPPVTRNDNFYGKKNYYIGKVLVKYNSTSGAINRGDDIPSGNRINYGKQTAWKEEFIGLSLKYLWSEKKN